MKKALSVLAIIALVSFTPSQPKVYKFEFTAEEAQVIFEALGELPSKKVEGIRFKMMTAVQAQSDTTKVKR
jgi:hypothetical protein